GPWTNLSTGGANRLPLHGDPTDPLGNFEIVFVDYSRLAPSRVYVWLTRPNTSVALFTTSDVTGDWQQVPSTTIPGPAYGYYAKAFAVAANAPGSGDGSSDILFIGSETFWRSTDGGRSWHDDRGFMS